MTHKELVRIGKLYLSFTKGCNPVFCEKGSAGINEFPDVIGFKALETFVIECKTSVSDFMADLKKNFRIVEDEGMGTQRYYLMPPEIYEKVKEKIPDGWGVLVINQGVAQQIRFKGSKDFKSNLQAERNYLRSRIFEIQEFGR